MSSIRAAGQAQPPKNLPLTILDALRVTDTDLLHAVRSDVRKMRLKGVEAGFTVCDDLSPSIKNVLSRRAERNLKQCKEHFGDDRKRRLLEENLRQILERYFLLLNFELAGGKIFRITRGLADRLFHTRMDAPTCAVKMPLKSLMFIFDDRAAIDAFRQTYPNLNPNSTDSPESVSVLLVDIDEFDSRRLWIGSFLQSGHRIVAAMSRFLRYADNGAEAMLESTWSGPNAKAESAFVEKSRSFHRLILNTLLYVSHVRAVENPDTGACSMPPRNGGPVNMQIVGEGVALLSYSRIGARTISGEVHQQSLSASRQLVIGHWKWHAHGPGRSLRRLIWIKPYIRGPKTAEISNKVRIVL